MDAQILLTDIAISDKVRSLALGVYKRIGNDPIDLPDSEADLVHEFFEYVVKAKIFGQESISPSVMHLMEIEHVMILSAFIRSFRK